jgi:hypothetical protein
MRIFAAPPNFACSVMLLALVASSQAKVVLIAARGAAASSVD